MPAVRDCERKTWQAQHVLFKQRAAISKLRRDNLALKDELMLNNKFSVAPTQTSAAEIISNLQSQGDVYITKIQTEQQLLGNVSKQLRKAKDAVAAQRKQMGGMDAAAKQQSKAQTSIHLLEDKLKSRYQALNDEGALIRAVRWKVDGLRRERLLFDDVLRNCDREWMNQRGEMSSLIKETTAAHQQFIKVLEDAAALKRSSDQETAGCEAEWRQLSKLIEADRQLQEAARDKEVEERDRKTALLLSSTGPHLANAETATPASGAAGRPGTAVHSDGDNAAGPTSLRRMSDLTSSFEAIQAATGEGDMAKLASAMNAAEESLFAQFTYLSELQLGVERLDRQIRNARENMESIQAAATITESASKEEQQELAARLLHEEQKAANAELRKQDALHAIANLCTCVEATFVAVGCTREAVVKEMLGSDGANHSNIIQYLGILEQRMLELLQVREAMMESAQHTALRASTDVIVATDEEARSYRRTTQLSSHLRPSATGSIASSIGGTRRRDPSGKLAGRKRMDVRGGSEAGSVALKGRADGEGKQAASSGQYAGEFLKGGFMRGVPPNMLPPLVADDGDPTADLEKDDTTFLDQDTLKARAVRSLALRSAHTSAAAAATTAAAAAATRVSGQASGTPSTDSRSTRRGNPGQASKGRPSPVPVTQ